MSVFRSVSIRLFYFLHTHICFWQIALLDMLHAHSVSTLEHILLPIVGFGLEWVVSLGKPDSKRVCFFVQDYPPNKFNIFYVFDFESNI